MSRDEESSVPVILAATSAEWQIQMLNPKKEKWSGQNSSNLSVDAFYS